MILTHGFEGVNNQSGTRMMSVKSLGVVDCPSINQVPS